MPKSSSYQGISGPMTPTTTSSSSLSQERLKFDEEGPKSKKAKPDFDTFRVVPKSDSISYSTPFITPTKSKEEAILRKMVHKSKDGEEYLYGFFVFNAVRIKDSIDQISEGTDPKIAQGKNYSKFSISHF
jgi:hypothetical protein